MINIVGIKKKPHERIQPKTRCTRRGLLHPLDQDLYPMWLAVAMSNIDMDKSFPNSIKLLLQYWATCARKVGLIDAKVYANC